MEACAEDCSSQHYPSFPYDEGEEGFYTKVLPILLSAMVVVVSWLAGRFINKFDVTSTGSGSIPRVKSGIGQMKRSASHDKYADFHSARGGGTGGVGVAEELERISVDDEGRLYNEQYGSEHSQEDGDRYDALGDSPGAQGPSSQGPRSPSVYSHFSQSVFSQSAYGPSAYGPSQRRLGASGSVGGGSSQYDAASSLGSQYPGPVPSQLSEGVSFNGGPGGVIYANGSTGIQYTNAAGARGAVGRGYPIYLPPGSAGRGTTAGATTIPPDMREGGGAYGHRQGLGSPPPYASQPDNMMSVPSVLPKDDESASGGAYEQTQGGHPPAYAYHRQRPNEHASAVDVGGHAPVACRDPQRSTAWEFGGGSRVHQEVEHPNVAPMGAGSVAESSVVEGVQSGFGSASEWEARDDRRPNFRA